MVVARGSRRAQCAGSWCADTHALPFAYCARVIPQPPMYGKATGIYIVTQLGPNAFFTACKHFPLNDLEANLHLVAAQARARRTR
jgi:hypothetical protein